MAFDVESMSARQDRREHLISSYNAAMSEAELAESRRFATRLGTNRGATP